MTSILKKIFLFFAAAFIMTAHVSMHQAKAQESNTENSSNSTRYRDAYLPAQSNGSYNNPILSIEKPPIENITN